MQRRNVNPWQWQDQFGFSQSIEVTGGQQVLYCAGQTSIDAQGNAVSLTHTLGTAAGALLLRHADAVSGRLRLAASQSLR